MKAGPGARRNVDAFLSKLWKLEAQLQAAGFPAMPEWWRREIERFYRTGKRRWVVRKGRRVYASTCVAPRLAVAEMLFGAHAHLPGTPPLVYAFLSVKRDEAAARLRGVTAILEVLGVKHEVRGETVELVEFPAVFKVVTASERTAVGETLAFGWCDEIARWRDDTSGANPAEQVVGALSPALATLPDAKLLLVSSPFTTDDFHARSFDLGETDQQCVSFGATWEINATLTEQACREMEPNPRLFAMHYGAQPVASVAGALDPDDVIACIGDPAPDDEPVAYFCGADPATGQGDDAFGYVFGYTNKRGQMVVTDAAETRERDTDIVIAGIGSVCRERRVTSVYADNYGGPFIATRFREIGKIELVQTQWTNGQKQDAVYRLRSMLRTRSIVLPRSTTLRADMLRLKEKLTPAGNFVYDTNGRDTLAALLAVLMAVDAGQITLGEHWIAGLMRSMRATDGKPPQTREDEERDRKARELGEAGLRWRQAQIAAGTANPGAALAQHVRSGGYDPAHAFSTNLGSFQ